MASDRLRAWRKLCFIPWNDAYYLFENTHTKKGSRVIGRHCKHSVPKQQECYWEGRGMRALESQALAKSVLILSAQSSDVPVPNQDKDLSLPALPEGIEGALSPCTVFFLGCHLSESWENSLDTCFLPDHQSPTSLSSLPQCKVDCKTSEDWCFFFIQICCLFSKGSQPPDKGEGSWQKQALSRVLCPSP